MLELEAVLQLRAHLYLPPTHTILKGLSPKDVNAWATALVLGKANSFFEAS